ncbi:MAG: hypothetical protein ACT4OI_02560 [Methanobacteriota archaeon]
MEELRMRVGGLIFVCVVALLMPAMFAAPARGQAVTLTVTFHNEPFAFPAVLPCLGLDGFVSGLQTGVIHVSLSAKGTANVQFTGTGTFTFAADGFSVSGRFTMWFGGQVNVVNGEFTATFLINGVASDGSVFRFFAVAHITIVGADVIVAFEKALCP